MKKFLIKCTGLLIGLVFIFSLLPQSAATVVWEDDFNDGTYEPEWTVVLGDWRVVEGVLETYYVDNLDHRISHPSSQIVGTWSFDVFPSDDISPATVWFITNGTDTPDENYGYGVRILDDSVTMHKLNGDYLSTSPIYGALYISDSDFEDVWIHINVTRNSSGEFSVYVNDTSTTEPNFSVTDTEYDYSTRMLIDYKGATVKFDNIMVVDELPPDPTPTETTTTTTTTSDSGGTQLWDITLIIAGVGVAGVVIIVGVVFLKRR